MADTLDIKISTSVQLNALRELEASLERQIAQARALGQTGTQAYAQMESQLGQVRGKLSGFGLFDKMKADAAGLATSIPGLGNAIGLLANPIAAAGAVALGASKGFISLMESGVRLNEQLKQAQIGIAGVIKQFDTTGNLTFDKAMKQSAGAIELLRKKAAESPATFQELAASYQATAGAMMSSGMSVKQQVDTIVLMSQTLQGLGIQSEQIIQESRAILTGNITEDAAAARILGITREMIETAKEEGRLYDFLTGKLAGFAEAGKVAEQTITVKASNMQDAWDSLLFTFTKPLFDSGVFQSFFGWITGMINAADEFLKLWQEGLADIDSWIRGTKGGAQEASAAIDQTAEAAAKAADVTKDAAEKAKKAHEDELKAIENKRRALDELKDAQLSRQIAAIDLEETKAMQAIDSDASLTPEQKAARKAALKQDYTAKRSEARFAREEDQAKQNMAAASREFATADNALKNFDPAALAEAQNKLSESIKLFQSLDLKSAGLDESDTGNIKEILATFREQAKNAKENNIGFSRSGNTEAAQMAANLEYELNQKIQRIERYLQSGVDIETYRKQVDTSARELQTLETNREAARARQQAAGLELGRMQDSKQQFALQNNSATTGALVQSQNADIAAAQAQAQAAGALDQQRAQAVGSDYKNIGESGVGRGRAGGTEAARRLGAAAAALEDGATAEEADEFLKAADNLEKFIGKNTDMMAKLREAMDKIQRVASGNQSQG